MANSIEEYTKAARALQPGFGPVQDWTDPTRGTTVQSEGGIPEDLSSSEPGQKFSLAQLPDPAVARAYGQGHAPVPEYLILEDGSDDPQGPEPSEIPVQKHRASLGHPVLGYDGTVTTADKLLEALDANTGDNAAASGTATGTESPSKTEDNTGDKGKGEGKSDASKQETTPSASATATPNAS